jgi:hypothetical protein
MFPAVLDCHIQVFFGAFMVFAVHGLVSSRCYKGLRQIPRNPRSDRFAAGWFEHISFSPSA